MRLVALAIAALVTLSGNAWGWGDHGHKVVCEIAFRLAMSDTRARIRRLIRNDRQFDFFSDACTWPDHPRRRDSEHFINLPRNAEGLTSDACPLAPKCILTAIENDVAVLSSAAARPVDKLASLKFLALQLHGSFEVSLVGCGLVGSSPGRPSDHNSRCNPPLG